MSGEEVKVYRGGRVIRTIRRADFAAHGARVAPDYIVLNEHGRIVAMAGRGHAPGLVIEAFEHMCSGAPPRADIEL